MGWLTFAQPQAGVALVVVVSLIAALGVAPSLVATFALILAICGRWLVGIDAIPAIASYVDIPLIWFAFLSALARKAFYSREGGDAFVPSVNVQLARRLVFVITVLAGVVAVSSLINQSQPARGLLYLLILGAPFALVATFLIAPPAPEIAKHLTRLVLAVAVVQIPISLFQGLHFGVGDHIQGTLYGAGAGHHVMSAVVIVAAVWVVTRADIPHLRRTVLAGLLTVIPFLADAKQVIFALPVALLGYRIRSMKFWGPAAAACALAVVGLLHFYPPGSTTLETAAQAAGKSGGKRIAAEAIWSDASRDPATLVAGQGPAETVSRTAFMTTELFLKADSPLRYVGLSPAETAVRIQRASVAANGGRSSVSGGLSSALGTFGDLGLLGLGAYITAVLIIVRALRQQSSAIGQAAAGGWALLLTLGAAFDWWEQPPFTLYVAMLSALALVGPNGRPQASGPRTMP